MNRDGYQKLNKRQLKNITRKFVGYHTNTEVIKPRDPKPVKRRPDISTELPTQNQRPQRRIINVAARIR
jgi:hypothetical protein